MRMVNCLIASVALISVQSATAREIKVEFGQSIQGAVDLAAPGDHIKVQPGIYHEPGRPCPTHPTEVCAVVVSKDNISLIAESLPGRPVVIENPGGQQQGIAFGKPSVNPTQCPSDPSQHISGAEISGFVVRNFLGSGIFLFCVDNFTISSNDAADNRLYGIFPVFSSDGRISHNVVSGAHDTGIYVGQSRNLHVDQNIAHDNVSGIEIENSVDVEVESAARLLRLPR
jgi:parallel beta-helix repeat protein